MSKLIKFDPASARRARELLDSLPREDVEAIILLVAGMFLDEIEDGLNDDEFNPEERPFFEAVNDLYRDAETGCYFCDYRIDGNEAEFNLDVHLCLLCMMKIANVLAAFGVDHTRLFPGMGPRNIQKTRLNNTPAGVATVCEFCHQDKKEGVGCEAEVYRYPGDLLLRRIPYGEETRFGENASFPNFCHECKVKLGQYHHWECFMEECPNCRNQLISCDCATRRNKEH